MEKFRDKLRYIAIVLLCLINLGFGLLAAQPPMVLGGTVGLVYVATAATRGESADATVELAQ